MSASFQLLHKPLRVPVSCQRPPQFLGPKVHLLPQSDRTPLYPKTCRRQGTTAAQLSAAVELKEVPQIPPPPSVAPHPKLSSDALGYNSLCPPQLCSLSTHPMRSKLRGGGKPEPHHGTRDKKARLFWGGVCHSPQPFPVLLRLSPSSVSLGSRQGRV